MTRKPCLHCDHPLTKHVKFPDPCGPGRCKVCTRGQTTWVYCPGCKRDLCTEPNTTVTDTDLVRYVCGNCGARSSWLFDAPVPIYIEETV